MQNDKRRQFLPDRQSLTPPTARKVHPKANIASNIALSDSSQANPTHLNRTLPVLVFIFCVAYLCLFLRYSSLEPDEGIVLQGAQRILNGQVPYRDFFSFYTPGSFYLVAATLKLFGDSFLVARLNLAIAGAGCSVLTYLLAIRVCTGGYALFAATLTTCSAVAYRFLVLHNWYSTLLAGLGLYCAVRLLESRKPMWAFATGSFCSLTTMFEQSKGAGLCFGLVLSFVALRVVGQKSAFQKPDLKMFALGFLWPLLLVFAYFGAQHSLSALVKDWLWPLNHYTNANHVFYGYQNWSDSARDAIFHSGPMWTRVIKILAISPGFLVPLLPVIAVGSFVYLILPSRRQYVSLNKWNYYIVVSGVLSGLLVSVLVVRADIIHFMYLAPLWYVPLAWVFAAREFRNTTLLALRPYLIFFVAVAFGLMSLVILTTANGAHTQVPTRRGIIITSKHDDVLEYVQTHTTPAQNILVYPYLPLYYYLTGTRSPASFDYFQPGMNTPEQAREIIASLQSQNVNTVLFEASFNEKIGTSWPGTPLNAIANDPVADYIVRNYRSCKVLNSASGSTFQFMVQKRKECP